MLFLFHKSQEFSLLLSATCVPCAMQRLRDSPSQDNTPENVEMVDHILGNVSGDVPELGGILSAVLAYAVPWNDVTIFTRVVEGTEQDEYNCDLFGFFGQEKLLEICRTFPFKEVQHTSVQVPVHHTALQTDRITFENSLTTILDASATFQQQVDLIRALRTQSSAGDSAQDVSEWCSERITQVLGCLDLDFSTDDIPTLLSVIAERDLSVIPNVFVLFDFVWISVINHGLVQHPPAIPAKRR